MTLKTVKRILISLLAVFMGLILLMGATGHPVYGYIAIGLVVLYGIFHLLFWHCPACSRNLGALWVRHCPHCGEKLF